MDNFLKDITLLFEHYKELGEKTIAQLKDEQLFWQYNNESNSIATIVKHLNGNMLSRFTDFLTSDGEKEWRKRDEEFENDIKSRTIVLVKWNEGWNCLSAALKSLDESDLSKEIFIRGEKHSVESALLRQLAHYSYHIGQIVFIGKMLLDNKWKSLSIPKGQSKTFNAQMFSKKKH